ncbi:MAG: hypothetical protein AUJ51_13535 [Elusimicrobia bacterium CG1_02_56_21]|nr:MAG: hypothetical protein AUJ51_13535 [Elusimicrobia bacterium CG1_02_56_21]
MRGKNLAAGKDKKLGNKTAVQSRTAIESILKGYPQRLRRSITYDNGSENIEHMTLNKAIGTRSYFFERIIVGRRGR